MVLLAAVVWFAVVRFVFERSVTYSLVFAAASFPVVLIVSWLMWRFRRLLGWEPPHDKTGASPPGRTR